MLETLRNAGVHFKDIACFGVETRLQIAANVTINAVRFTDPATGGELQTDLRRGETLNE
jgi:hypothetical protein